MGSDSLVSFPCSKIATFFMLYLCYNFHGYIWNLHTHSLFKLAQCNFIILWDKDKNKKIHLSLNVLTLLTLSFSLCEFVLLPTVNSFQPEELSLLFLSPQPSSPSLPPPFLSLLFNLNNVLSVHCCVPMWAHMLWWAHKSRRTTRVYWTSPFTVWAQELDSGYQGWQWRPLPSEPPPQLCSYAF